MLEIQKFLIQYDDALERLTKPPYNLKIKSKNGLYIFSYRQFDSDFTLEIVKESRGLILEADTWKVVRYSFKKFGNYGESYADKIDWDSAVVTEKIDGSIIALYYYNGKWNVATNGMIDAEDAPLMETCIYKNYKELFDSAAKKVGLDYSHLNTSMCYTFELVSEFNKIVLDYPLDLYHLSTRNLTTLEEIEIDIGIRKPQTFALSSLADVIDAAKALGKNGEGFVVKDKNCNRIKVKSPEYVLGHKLRDSVTTAELLDIVKRGEQEEFLTYFSVLKSRIQRIEQYYKEVSKAISQQVTNAINLYKENSNRKDFALAIDSQKIPIAYRQFYFTAYGELTAHRDSPYKTIIKKYFDNTPSAKILKTFPIDDFTLN
jgi:hypothetical protein